MSDTSSSLKICLIGCGHMGRLHAISITNHPIQTKLTVADVNEGSAAVLASEVGAQATTVETALDGGFDAYIIASPPHLHLEHTLAALNQQTYVFCEKPLGSTLDDIEAVLPELRQYSKRVQMGFNRRFDPHVASMKKRLIAGDIGEIEQLHIVSRDHHAPSVEGLAKAAGLIAETAIHDFDIVRHLLGSEPNNVFCQGAVLVNPDYASVNRIDTATTMLTTAKGQQIVIQNCLRSSYGYDQRIEAFGSKGRLVMKNQRQTEVALEDHNGMHDALISDDWSTRYLEAYAIEMGSFLECVQSKGIPSPSLLDGVKASQLAACAQQSLTNGMPVQIVSYQI